MTTYKNCNHPPIPCRSPCDIEKVSQKWKNATKERENESSGPLAISLIQSGCHPARAMVCASQEGYGMTSAPTILSAYMEQKKDRNHALDKGIGFCDQCKPGTNTFAYYSSKYRGDCSIILIDLGNMPMETSNRVLCIGKNGKLKYCDTGEFMAVSHVWEHGWQGSSEHGICCRVLKMLLEIAKKFDLDWIWLDIVMVSSNREMKIRAINSMNRVYSTAAVTLVCDRLLLSMKGGTVREKALAISLCDWFTRVWTMQESILSQKLIFLQRDRYWTGNCLLKSLMKDSSEGTDNWQWFGAIYTICGIVESSGQPIERIFYANGSRRTTESIDMNRALFPLFKLEWPNTKPTLADAQIMLLKHLGTDAARCAFVFGPIGLPSPWGWAPLCFSACSGVLMNPSDLMTPTKYGLEGDWSYQEVELDSHRSLEVGNRGLLEIYINRLREIVNQIEIRTAGAEIDRGLSIMGLIMGSLDFSTYLGGLYITGGTEDLERDIQNLITECHRSLSNLRGLTIIDERTDIKLRILERIVKELEFLMENLKANTTDRREDPQNTYPKFISEKLCSKISWMRFSTIDAEIYAIVYHTESNLSLWRKERLFLLGPPPNSNIDGSFNWYKLGSVTQTSVNMNIMRCIGSMKAMLPWSQFLLNAEFCHGILS